MSTKPTKQTTTLANDLDRLLTNYKRAIDMLLEAMGPGVTQGQRDELKKALSPLGSKGSGSKASAPDA